MSKTQMVQSVSVSPEEQAANVRNALRNSLYPGAADQSIDMVLAYCHAAKLDPLTKPVHIVGMSVQVGKGKYEWRDVIMPGIELYRTKAHDTGKYAGQDEAEYGPDCILEVGGRSYPYPAWCRVTVYRIVDGLKVAFRARAFWIESYATASKDTDAPNKMWAKRPYGQLEKCAEALALRKAFPEAVGATPTAEEMEGKTFRVEQLDDAKPGHARMPSEKAAAHTAAANDIVDGEFDDSNEPDRKDHERAHDANEGQQSADPKGDSNACAWEISEGQKRLLIAKGKSKGFDEAAMIAKWPRITSDNFSEVSAAVTSMKAP